jgi:hypothetical protein
MSVGITMRRGNAAFSFTHIESFDNVDVSQGKPPSWTETLQNLRFANQKLKESARSRWDSC